MYWSLPWSLTETNFFLVSNRDQSRDQIFWSQLETNTKFRSLWLFCGKIFPPFSVAILRPLEMLVWTRDRNLISVSKIWKIPAAFRCFSCICQIYLHIQPVKFFQPANHVLHSTHSSESCSQQHFLKPHIQYPDTSITTKVVWNNIQSVYPHI